MKLRTAPGRIRLASSASIGACVVAAAGLAAASLAGPAQARQAEGLDMPSRTLVGGYLSGRFAKSQHDIRSAAAFYGSALAHDPENEVLVEQAFLMELSAGNHTIRFKAVNKNPASRNFFFAIDTIDLLN